MSNKALIIDSDVEFIEQLQDAAQRLGLDAETTTNGNEGVDLASLDQPAIVFLGVMDSKGAGYGLCSKLRRRAPTVPVVMIIDSDEQGSERLDRHQALKTGADAYLVRPFTAALLFETLERIAPGLVPAPNDPGEVIGETGIVPNDSLLGASLFNDDELRELEKEAEQAFSSIVVDPVASANAGEFEVDELDLVSVEPTSDVPGDDDGEGVGGEEGTQVYELDSVDLDAPIPRNRPISGSMPLAAIAPPLEPVDLDDPSEFEMPEDSDLPSEPPPTPPAPLARQSSTPSMAPPTRDRAEMQAETEAHETAQIERENRSLRARVAELEQGLKATREELARRDAEASTQRLSDSAAKRELIEVREDLNRREREVLELRDRQTSKDRQLVDLGDQLDTLRAEKERLESEIRSSEGRIGLVQQTREEAEHEIENLRVRLSETRVRLDRAKEEADKTYEEIKVSQRKAHQELQAAKDAGANVLAEAERLHAQRIAGLEARLTNAQQAGETGRQMAERQVADLKAENARALAAKTESHEVAIQEAQAEHEGEMGRLRAEQSQLRAQLESAHQTALSEAAEARDTALTEAKAEAEARQATQRRTFEEELAGLRIELETLGEELEAEAARHKADVARANEAAEATSADLSAQITAQTIRAESSAAEVLRLAGELATLRTSTETEQAQAAQVRGELEAALSTEKRVRADDVAERDARIMDMIQQISAHATRIAELDTAMELLNDELASRENELAARGRDVHQLSQTILALDQRITHLEGDLEAARAAADKTRAALGVALAFLDRVPAVRPTEAAPPRDE